MSTKRNPEQWVISNDTGISCEVRSGMTIVAKVPCGESIANARLIAAAPDLLSELEAAHHIILNALAVMTIEQKLEWDRLNASANVDGEGITRANERAALIAKATGET